MKELICFLIGGFLFLSCNNSNKNINVGKDLLPDSIPYVEHESSDGLGTNNNNDCIKAFETLGDTIFGDVLYGMDKKQAINSIRKFQSKLDIFKYKRYNKPDGNGFIFANVKFMDIDVVEFEKEVLDVSTTRGRYYSSFTWKGKLSQIVWESFYISKNGKSEVGAQLGKFVSFFETKYGKCTSKGISSRNWFYTDYERRKNYFSGGIVAEWKTDNRLVQISIKGKECPEYGNERGEYKYTIFVRFFDRTIDKEIESYIEEKKSIQNSRIKEQRQKSINAL